MNITIIGAGAVGGYFGARLHDAGANVTFLVREKRKKQLDEDGLNVTSVNGDTYLKEPNVVTNASDIEACDLLILSVKGYHLDGIYPQLEVLVNKGAKILPLLNGMEHYEVLEKKVGQEAVIGGLCFIISTLDKGHIVHTSKQHDLIFGPLKESQRALCKKLAMILEQANVNFTCTDEIQNEIWNKYAFITAYSGVTTASRLEIGAIRKQKETLTLYKEVAEEMRQLAEAYGVNLGGDQFLQSIEEKSFQFPEYATSSMHQDFRKGLPLELDSLQGGALRMAESKGLKLPIIKTLYGLLKPFESGHA
ncbi:ketopantoate reductase family protein [Oceanobacillus bengalensis]|uniref:2-dehydropantoate 2-reductase n=1 Tax=Oceanobacillus bengalensis TaxID=1435466 RepID=A0A494Z5Q1_9BACI|nr:ketopantoate reductase family protein [Oceanobacillus bengalensis]